MATVNRINNTPSIDLVPQMNQKVFDFSNERFDDIQILRYHLCGFEKLSLRQKKYVYCLSQATLWGRDITFDQFGKYNLKIRRALEAIFLSKFKEESDDFRALELYLKKVWFANGIYHHYSSDKFVPGFSKIYFVDALHHVDISLLRLDEGETLEIFITNLEKVLFDPNYLPKRVNKADGQDIVKTSACNYYEHVSQAEVEQFYEHKKKKAHDNPPSFGLNSKVIKENGVIRELVWKAGGQYGSAIRRIIEWLDKAKRYAENSRQVQTIELLIKFYKSGNLTDFDNYSIAWVNDLEGQVDFINGFIEVYGDPLGYKGSWEGIVHYKDLEETKRTRLISDNAQWFEDNSPTDKRFKKSEVKGVTANVVCAAMLGGDEYPSTAIGINLPNADWIRAEHGSKSVTISNLIHAYDEASKNNGFLEEFVIDKGTLDLIKQYGNQTDILHTDIHECLGHGSGKLLSGIDTDALKNYGNTIEETRADLFGLYYMPDDKLLSLGLLNSEEAYKARYYSYLMNGLLTQLARIKPGKSIEEAHMQNRALIARWALELGKKAKVAELISISGKTFLRINDYLALRDIFAYELAEIQRIKSEGDFDKGRQLVEKYAINIDLTLHKEILSRYDSLDIAPYKGFLNPKMEIVHNASGEIADIRIDYTESYTDQMLRYSNEYGIL